MSEAIEWEAVGDAPDGDAPGANADDEVAETTVDDAAVVEPEASIQTGRYTVGLGVAMVAGVLGGVLGNPTMVAASTVGLAFAVYGYATRPPELAVTVDREVSDRSPLPGETVEVRVTVENHGDRAVADLRVADAVPEGFEVVEGTPSLSARLDAGEVERYEYAVRARRGEYVLGPTVVTARNVSGGEERRRELDDAVEISVRAGPRSVPLSEGTVAHTGRIDTDEGGAGIEFHSTRQYHPNDPMNRIDWNRYASTNELTTVNYRREQSAVVVVLVDVRSSVAVRRSPTEPDAVELGRYAGGRLVDSLLDHNDRVGVGLYGEGTLLEPAQRRGQALRAERLLDGGADAVDGGVVTTRGGRGVSFFRDHVSPEAQFVIVSPLVDDDPVEAATRLGAHGHAVTVLSPDVTTDETAGSAVSRVERARRIHDLRGSGVRVQEWSPDEPLFTTMSRAAERWSA